MITLPILWIIYHHAPNASDEDDFALLLAASAFPIDVRVAFMGEGVLQLIENTQEERIARFRGLPHYGIESLYVEKESLSSHHISSDDLCIKTHVLSHAELKAHFQEARWVMHR